jgi:ParB family chromosome partitioning protein
VSRKCGIGRHISALFWNYRELIGTGHAMLLAKLQPAQQEEARSACYQEQYGTNNKSKRTLLPLRHLQSWTEHNILFELASAPFFKKHAELGPEVRSCIDCPKRTEHNKLLFADMRTGHKISCSDPKCYATK